MKELPRGAAALILILGLMLLVFLAMQLRNNDVIKQNGPTLDQMDIQTGNPQRAGKNIIP